LLAVPGAALADGELVRVPPAPHVYRIVGGAPLHIVICDGRNNDCQPQTEVANLNGYRQYPRDGAMSSGGSDGGIYRWAGGAPLWVSRCDYGGGCGPAVLIDDNAYAQWDHRRRYPADGTVIHNVDDGGDYRFAGGAPLRVDCARGPGCASMTELDGGTFAYFGSASADKNMRQFPASGTTVLNVDNGVYYRFVGGAALPLSGCAGCAAVAVDNRTFQTLGTATPSLPHMVATVPDGQLIATSTATYRTAGGAAVQLTDCAPIGGCASPVAVDAGTIASLPPAPRDGTVLRGLPSKRTWEIVAGKRRETFIARLDAVDVDDGAINLIPLDAPAPPPPAPEVFKPVISSGYRVLGRYTRFTSLKVRGALPGSLVTVSCSGKRKGCPFKKARRHRLGGTSLNVHKRWLKKARLRSGAKVTVRVTSPTGQRKQMTFQIRSRKLPVRKTRCSAAGAKLTRCA
jgi:hypothetical protein